VSIDGDQRTCVRCGKGLPGMSKMTEEKLTAEEAAKNGWLGRLGVDGSIIVAMCLQCQIERAEDRRGRTVSP